MPLPSPSGWVSDQELMRQFMRPDGTVDQQALFQATMARNAQYNPEGDPSLGADVNFGYSGLQDQYGNTGTRHFTPEELAQNGGAPMTFFTDPGRVWTTTDQQEIADRRDDQRTRMQQGAATIAAMIGGAQFLPGGAFNSGATGTGTATITGANTAAGYAAPAATTAAGLPTGAGIAAAPLTAGTGAVGGGLLPGVTAGAGGLSGIAAGGGSQFLNWLPEITGGFNALLGARTADRAADAESAALQAAIDEQRRQYDTTRSDLMPWLEAGRGALGRLNDPNAFTASPDYNFIRSEGQRDIGNSFAARGGAASGNALRALTEFNSNLAAGDYNNWWNRQAGLAGVGQNTATNLGSMGQRSTENVGNYLAGQGASRASGIWGRNSALAQGANDVVSNYLYRRRVA